MFWKPPGTVILKRADCYFWPDGFWLDYTGSISGVRTWWLKAPMEFFLEYRPGRWFGLLLDNLRLF